MSLQQSCKVLWEKARLLKICLTSCSSRSTAKSAAITLGVSVAAKHSAEHCLSRSLTGQGPLPADKT